MGNACFLDWQESDGQFVYLVLEKCQGTLGEFDKLPAGLRPEEVLVVAFLVFSFPLGVALFLKTVLEHRF